VPALVVVEAVAPVDTTARAFAVLSNSCRESTSHSRLEKNASAAALSKHEPTRPIDWRISSRRHRAVNFSAV
jgi:hypothetical protein